jgi:hypothetical protein
VAREGYHVEVRGYAELAEGTRMLAENILRGSRESFGRAADAAAQVLRGRLHVDTGATLASVQARPGDAGALVAMGEGVEYAEFQEYGGRGWPHSSEGNFLYPSAMSVEPVLIAQAEKTATQEIGATRWPRP